MIAKNFSWLALSALAAACFLGFQTAQAGHTNVYNEAGSLIDTGNYSGVATGADDGYWFANFGAAANTGSATNANEASNIPSWIQLDSDPNSANYSFQDSPDSLTNGGLAGYDDFILPGGGAAQRSGEVEDTSNVGGGTDNFVEMIVLQSMVSASFYVVIDNADVSVTGTTNYNPNSRLRFRVRHSDDEGDIQEEAKQGGNRVGDANNATADAYRFDTTGLVAGDIVKIRISSSGASLGGIAGIMFEGVPVPEPTSAVLLLLGGMGLSFAGRRRLRA